MNRATPQGSDPFRLPVGLSNVWFVFIIASVLRTEAHAMNRSSAGLRAFTLVELLVVVSLIVLIIALLFPAYNSAVETARRTICRSNLRQIVMGAQAHTFASRTMAYSPTMDNGDDSLAFLYPYYISGEVVCPSTENRVRLDVFYNDTGHRYAQPVPQDLHQVAANALDKTGHSYETWAWMSSGIFPDGTRLHGRDFGTRNKQRGVRTGEPSAIDPDAATSEVLKTKKSVRKPATTLLSVDSDQGGGAGDPTDVNNWPDKVNNHGEDGLNISFLDGSVRWYDKSQTLVEVYINSYHHSQPPNWPVVHPGLKTQTVKGDDGYNYTRWYFQ